MGEMRTLKKRCFLAVVLLLLSLSAACADSEFTEIKFTKFPEKYQQFHRYPWEMFDFEEFSQAYQKILEDFPDGTYRDDFIFELFVVSTQNRFVSTNQGGFVFMGGCKPHYCGAAEIFVLYDPEKAKAWALILAVDIFPRPKYEAWLGNPDQNTKQLIEKLREMWWS